MRAMVRQQWRHDLLDEALGPDLVRVEVRAWCTLAPLKTRVDLPTTPQRLLGYLAKVGPRQLLRKIVSRLGEGGATERFLAAGVGVVLEHEVEGEVAADISVGHMVCFLATRHLRVQERVVVHYSWLHPVAHGHPLEQSAPEELRWWDAASEQWPGAVLAHAGEDPRVGAPTAPTPPQWEGVEESLLRGPRGGGAGAPATRRDVSTPVATTRRARPLPRRFAALFGWGHYARTCILPTWTQSMPVGRIHELQPALMPDTPAAHAAHWTTSPRPQPEDDAAAVWLIAGHHHTHAPLARAALMRGIPAVVEKPPVVSLAQLDALLDTMRHHPETPLVLGFHRRHAPYAQWLRRDLMWRGACSPCDMHTIVHEVRLPPHHWYRWEHVGGRLVSNGCHWIDQFFWLNDFCPHRHFDVAQSASGALSVRIELTNGATFTMALSDRGSARLGTRDVTECRRGPRTARIVDDRYVAESTRGVLRRTSIEEEAVYRAMYASFAQKILAGDCAGEDPDHFECVWRPLLEAAQRLSGQRGGGA